ncbi:helix-turn-helix domain-containing protein [[Mannheimia] succiniciproducens]|uniref:AraC protein n=1 Tax=Mannheimia succiniciproducens (strain KCTC 0769BP / MBEL55E) TaxID=221988 RepID=Q65SQ3_MANSM|nr:helix-turn-helix domain-containing protein [[Mannheimia] succiniciproducens]AAU38007.1 AraC protein [[Mannheimia] succiniciproducens MBEL55E]
MANIRQNQSISELHYQPHKHHPYGIELFTVASLRARSAEVVMEKNYLYQCDMIIVVTQGSGTLWQDFEPVACMQGSVLWIKQGQACSFGNDKHWDGWVLMIKNKPLLSEFDYQINTLWLSENELENVEQSLKQLKQDSEKPYSIVHKQLIHHQFYAFLWRLISLTPNQTILYSPRLRSRFDSFQSLLESYFHEWHHVHQYATALACSEKTLSRACLEITQQPAKTVINNRLLLEAKRLLVQSNQSIASISLQLGFNEATHFVKFFKREAGITPQKFRELG